MRWAMQNLSLTFTFGTHYLLLLTCNNIFNAGLVTCNRVSTVWHYYFYFSKKAKSFFQPLAK